jgi:hypothetical protein
MKDNFDQHKWFKNQYLNEDIHGETDYLQGNDVEQAVKGYITQALKSINQYQNNLHPSTGEVEIDYSEVSKHLREAFNSFDRIDYSSLDPKY